MLRLLGARFGVGVHYFNNYKGAGPGAKTPDSNASPAVGTARVRDLPSLRTIEGALC